MNSSEITVAQYLITRLKEIGIDHLFGVPGDFVLGFFNQVLKSNLKYVGSNPATLKEAINEALLMLNKSQKPIVIGDVELIRFKLQNEFARFLRKTGFPYVIMMLGKTVLSEQHPQFIGLFQGERSRDYVKNRVESADCILQFGALLLTDNYF